MPRFWNDQRRRQSGSGSRWRCAGVAEYERAHPISSLRSRAHDDDRKRMTLQMSSATQTSGEHVHPLIPLDVQREWRQKGYWGDQTLARDRQVMGRARSPSNCHHRRDSIYLLPTLGAARVASPDRFAKPDSSPDSTCLPSCRTLGKGS